MPKFSYTFFTCGLIALPIELFAADELYLGFKLGSQFADAHNYASANGWKLRRLSENLPNEWIVEGADGTLYVCDDKVLAIRRSLEGNVDDFVSMVDVLTRTQGRPETTIVPVHAGNVRISNIDARYENIDGSGVAIQLSSTDGKLRISTNVWSGEDCADQSE